MEINLPRGDGSITNEQFQIVLKAIEIIARQSESKTQFLEELKKLQEIKKTQ